MDIFLADLHIHSRFSRATSKSLDPLHLAAWAQVKGISLVGTGDFTHPGWMEMLQDHLVQGEDGLLHLKNEDDLSPLVEGFGHEIKARTKFLLSAEISSIYKQDGKVRKIHNLVYMPGFEQAQRFNRKLERIGNLKSDGRPILGLDSRSLLEMVLETDPYAYVVPAHIWTPWFSVFGSKSGFDSLEECYRDLTPHIFALETGLSSDPDMNWMWSALDRYSLVSNSDAHSAENLGREVNIFQGEMSYEGIFRALRREGLGHRFLGTMEFYPEEGKYHLDGHRKCGVMLDPRQTMASKGKCPVCGKPVTVGVLNRVLALADRDAPVQPSCQPGFYCVIPLKEVMAEILGVGPKTKKVQALYNQAVSRHGSEMNILRQVPVEELSRLSPVLAEAIQRMRAGDVIKEPGFDGQFGKISVFSARERREIKYGGAVFRVSHEDDAQGYVRSGSGPAESVQTPDAAEEEVVFNPQQLEAAAYDQGPLLVLAGPGTGKTQTLMGRAGHLLKQGINPRHILILTFTRKASREIKDRLALLHGREQALPRAETIHAMAYEYWQNIYGETPLILGEEEALKVFSQANPELKSAEVKEAWSQLNLARERREKISRAGENYSRQKQDWNLVDYVDLVEFWLEEIQSGKFVRPFTHVLVDEVQDLSRLQLDLIQGLLPENGAGFFGIGDPRQSIYGFRGALADSAESLTRRWSGLKTIHLLDNYRSSQKILDFSKALFPEDPALTARKNIDGQIYFFQAVDSIQENQWVAQKISGLLGGTAHWQEDSSNQDLVLAPGDMAVLVRFKGLIPELEKEMQRRGLPVSVPENQAYYRDPRVELILRAVARVMGVREDRKVFDCPEKILAGGPERMAAYLEDVPPFDRMFWQSRAFTELKKEYRRLGGWTELINEISLESELTQVEARAQKVRIMTMHAAKGLEFDTVFIPCLEDGIMPFAGAGMLLGKMSGKKERPDLEEEKRLLFVSLTRAKRCIHLSLAGSRKMFGRQLNLKESRFLKELPLEMARTTRGRIGKSRKVKQMRLG